MSILNKTIPFKSPYLNLGQERVKAKLILSFISSNLFRFLSDCFMSNSPQATFIKARGNSEYARTIQFNVSSNLKPRDSECCRNSIRVTSPVIQRHPEGAEQVRRTLSSSKCKQKSTTGCGGGRFLNIMPYLLPQQV